LQDGLGKQAVGDQHAHVAKLAAHHIVDHGRRGIGRGPPGRPLA
jgi:hypothetical protein